MSDQKGFTAFMETYVTFLEEMAQGEGEKYSALISYDPKRVDRVVSRQQAMNMRLTQLEEQREKEQEAAGFGGMSFQEILDRLSGPEKEALQGIFSRFTRAVGEIKYFNGKSVSFAKEGLHQMGLGEETAAPYTPKGKSPGEGVRGSSIFETQI